MNFFFMKHRTFTIPATNDLTLIPVTLLKITESNIFKNYLQQKEQKYTALNYVYMPLK